MRQNETGMEERRKGPKPKSLEKSTFWIVCGFQLGFSTLPNNACVHTKLIGKNATPHMAKIITIMNREKYNINAKGVTC